VRELGCACCPRGLCECVAADNGRYSGSFRDNLRNGRGVQVYPNGNRYKGLFSCDVRHGYGVLAYPNGDVFRGMFKADQRVNDSWEGIKFYECPPDPPQARALSQGDPAYVAIAQRRKRDRYVGPFKDLNRHGHGVCDYGDGSRYVGQWVDDLYEGQGTLTYRYASGCHPIRYVCLSVHHVTWQFLSDQSWYQGDWHLSMRHGDGEHFHAVTQER
jgi:hypothetical protein